MHGWARQAAQIGGDRETRTWQRACVGKSAMDRHELDCEEIELLVSELTAKQYAPVKAPVLPPVVSPHVDLRPGRWTNVQVAMPAWSKPPVDRRFAFASAISLPQLPDLSHIFRMPGPVAMVRIWVGLGAVHSALMTFWPYPKTYLLGLVLYILSLALVLVTGIWGARLSWDARLCAAHTVALGTAGWAVALAAVETLPQI
jgi:hypothetical protein